MLSEREERIRRYVEADLTAEERIAFELELAADPSLRSEVEGLRDLVAEARALPLHHAPPDLAARVRARVGAPSPRRRSPLVWVPATAAAAALVTLALFGLQSRMRPTPSPESMAAVTFELYAPGAQEVSVVGDFNRWRVGTIRLADPDRSGTWSVTVQVPPGRHQYQFVVNGQRWLPDPEAPLQVEDGFGNKNSVLQVSVTGSDRGRHTGIEGTEWARG